jgi:flavin-dependent dehydrogenase
MQAVSAGGRATAIADHHIAADIAADVAIVGAGPAGAAAALALARRGFEVVLLARDAPPRAEAGETLPAAALGALRALGLDGWFSGRYPEALGRASAWGSARLEVRDGFVDPSGAGWRLHRADFDAGLRRAAIVAGVTSIAIDGLSSIAESGDSRRRWRIATASPQGIGAVTVRYLVDATGARAALARRFGTRVRAIDALIAIQARIEGHPPGPFDAFTLVEAVPDGWLYAARLPDGAQVVVLHTDRDLLGAATPADALAAALADAPWCARRIGWTSASSCAAVSVRSAASGRLARASGPGWAAVGDAAMAADPLSSQGVMNALAGGLRVADAVADDLHGAAAALDSYAEGVDRGWRRFTAHRQAYYAMERRFADRPFWRRRATPVPSEG